MSVCRLRAPLLVCLIASALVFVLLGSQPSNLAPVHRRLLLSELPSNSSANSSSASFLAHQCLWSPAETSAVATAVATASGSGSAVAVATASATATTSATNRILISETTPAGSCSLNPSYFFSLSASGRGPAQDNEKLLLQITAMRYACLNHSAELTCSGDQGNWCMWQEGALGSKGHCELYFSDADFVHFLMWSSAKLACAGSSVAQIVQCSFEVSDTDCEKQTGCKWKEGACYPTWYPVTDPAALRKFKKQMHVADTEVWGRCAAANVYRQYSGLCNHQTEEACKSDANACTFVTEHEAEVVANPLNFTKPCVMSSAKFPLESVFLSNRVSPFAEAVFDAQASCTNTTDELSCNANTTALNKNVLDVAMNYSISTTNESAEAVGMTALAKDKKTKPDVVGTVHKASWAPPDLESKNKAAGLDQDLALPTLAIPASVSTTGLQLDILPTTNAPQAPPLADLLPLTGDGVTSASASASSSTSVSSSTSTVVIASSSAGDVPALAPLPPAIPAVPALPALESKNHGHWLKPIKTAEAIFDSVTFTVSQYNPSAANTPGTKAALSFLKILLRLRK